MCAVQTVGTVSVPTVNLEPTIGTILPVVNLHGQQKALEKHTSCRLAGISYVHGNNFGNFDYLCYPGIIAE